MPVGWADGRNTKLGKVMKLFQTIARCRENVRLLWNIDDFGEVITDLEHKIDELRDEVRELENPKDDPDLESNVGDLNNRLEVIEEAFGSLETVFQFANEQRGNL